MYKSRINANHRAITLGFSLLVLAKSYWIEFQLKDLSPKDFIILWIMFVTISSLVLGTWLKF